MLLGADLGAPQQIGLADHADHLEVAVDHREGADIVLDEKLDNRGSLRVGRDRDDVSHHDVRSPHRRPPYDRICPNRP
jgi:hypothetical protein